VGESVEMPVLEPLSAGGSRYRGFVEAIANGRVLGGGKGVKTGQEDSSRIVWIRSEKEVYCFRKVVATSCARGGRDRGMGLQ
jgi:hypothetical protein